MEARRTVPVLRIFSVEKAREFYCGFLGFKVDWERRLKDGAPLYMQVSRGGLALHLSEHHGDGSPGAVIFVDVTGLEDFHREINSRGYQYLRPGMTDAPWNARLMQVTDPFGNRIRFSESKGAAGTA